MVLAGTSAIALATGVHHHHGSHALAEGEHWSIEPDVLSNVVGLLRLKGREHCRSVLGARCAVRFPPSTCHFLVIESGSCTVGVPGFSLVEGKVGDVFILVVPADANPHHGEATLDWVVELGGGASTTVSCGSYAFNRKAAESLLSVLPALLHVSADRRQPDRWLDLSRRFLGAEASFTPLGCAFMATRLMELMFVEALRAWLTSQSPGIGRRLKALCDPQVGPALSRLHAEPAKPWTLDSLAAAANWSRSPLAARFRTLLGEPPMSYLTRLRMQHATQELSTTDKRVAQVAHDVGYDSEAAFSRVFKRFHGVAPATYKSRGATKAS